MASYTILYEPQPISKYFIISTMVKRFLYCSFGNTTFQLLKNSSGGNDLLGRRILCNYSGS